MLTYNNGIQASSHPGKMSYGVCIPQLVRHIRANRLGMHENLTGNQMGRCILMDRVHNCINFDSVARSQHCHFPDRWL